jgi:polar amino acid transport system permease protein
MPAEMLADRPATARGVERPDVVPLRHPGRWVTAAIIAVLGAYAIYFAVTNPRVGWDIVGDHLFAPAILEGLGRTLELTAIGMVGGTALGVLLAVGRLSPNPIVRGAAFLYIWFFRGTPLLVQLIFWFNLGALFPQISVGIPFGPTFASESANVLITAYTAAVLGLTLNEGAYMAEIVRGGILSVDKGQFDAASALGMTRLQTMRLVVLPQAMRVIVPPTGNETISMLKFTSLVSVIALPELLYSAQLIYNRTFETIPLLIVASIWYLVATSVLTVGQRFLERHYGKGYHQQ